MTFRYSNMQLCDKNDDTDNFPGVACVRVLLQSRDIFDTFYDVKCYVIFSQKFLTLSARLERNVMYLDKYFFGR